MKSGVELWYREKDDYLNKTGGITGHYTSMISPNNRYVGMGAFGTSTAQYASTSCAEFSGTNTSETFQFTYGDCIQTLEVPANAVTISSNQSKYLYYGDRKTLQLTASYNGNSGFPVEYAKWSSSAPGVVSIEGDNTAVVKDYGKATLTADLGGKTYTLNVEVKDIVKGDVECDGKIDSSDVFSTLLHAAASPPNSRFSSAVTMTRTSGAFRMTAVPSGWCWPPQKPCWIAVSSRKMTSCSACTARRNGDRATRSSTGRSARGK